MYLASNVNDWWGDQTARHDLDMLRSAIQYYQADYGPLDAVPAVTLSAKGPSRQRWLPRSEAARLLWAARRCPHIA